MLIKSKWEINPLVTQLLTFLKNTRGQKDARESEESNVYCQNIFNEKMILQKSDNPVASLQGGLIVRAIITVVLCVVRRYYYYLPPREARPLTECN